MEWLSRWMRPFGKSRWWSRRSSPRFSVSVMLRETPDLVCNLKISNPGPPFTLKSARLIAPRHALIYRREMFASDELKGFGFRELPLDQVVPAGATVEIPFEIWIPSASHRKRLRLGIRTSLRVRRFRCRPTSGAGPDARH